MGTGMRSVETTRVSRDEQGIYRWVYVLPMFKNLSILWTVLKAMGIIVLGIMLVMVYLFVSHGGGADDFWLIIGIPALCCSIALVIALLSYLFVAWYYGGKYVAIYRMDNHSLAQYQPKDQAQKAGLIGAVSSVTGAVTGNVGLMAVGLTQGGSLVVESKFEKIRSLKILPELSEIRIHSFFTWYTIYVNPADFNVVADYMANRCVNARIIRKET